jgi:hypothetical protein
MDESDTDLLAHESGEMAMREAEIGFVGDTL